MRATVVPFVLAAAGVIGCAAPAAAQGYVGPAKCINCHDHEDEAEWWEREDGPPPDGHINALRQMENVDSPQYAAAVGLDESLDGVYDLEGSCVTCHATVFKGDANAGISCESCHGPGSDYFDSHQEQNSYRDSLTRGMLDVVGNLQGWVEQCVRCHVMDDPRLIDAGHPSGDDFDVAEKFEVVQAHWGNEYRASAVAAAATAVRRAVLETRTAPPEDVVPTTSSAPATPAPTTGAPPAAVAAPPPRPAPPPPPARPATAAPAAAPAADPNPAPGPRPEARPAAAARTPRPPARPVAPPPRTTPPPAPRPDRTDPVVISETGAAVVEPLPALPRSPAALVAAIQGRAIVLLDRLLRRDGRAPVRVAPPEPPIDYRGPDAELLQLQQEVLALALEALGTAPAADPAADESSDP